MHDFDNLIKNNRISIIVKPNSNTNEILDVDIVTNTLKVAIKAVPEKGKANQELVKYISKLLKKKVKIIQGLKSHKKTLEII